MDIEMLRELIPMMQGAGEGVFVLMLIVIGKTYFGYALFTIVVLVGLDMVLKTVRSATRTSQACKVLWSEYRVGRGGRAHYGAWTGAEIDQLLRVIRATKGDQ